MEKLTPLLGHTNFETAYVIEDYPYGFTLRTKMYVWVESNKRGDRYVTQTINPKNGRLNAPKCSTYAPVVVIAQKENGHLVSYSFHGWDKEGFDKFMGFIGDRLPDMNEQQRHYIYQVAGRYAPVGELCLNS